MTNNDILKKLRVALQLRDEQIVEVLALVDFRISKGEINNFFSKYNTRRHCQKRYNSHCCGAESATQFQKIRRNAQYKSKLKGKRKQIKNRYGKNNP